MFYYGIDLVEIIQGRGIAPSLALMLISRLPDTSLTHALASGGEEHFGWGMDRHLSADLYDAISTNTRASGNWGTNTPPKIPSYPRPGQTEEPEEKKPSSVADLHKMLMSPR